MLSLHIEREFLENPEMTLSQSLTIVADDGPSEGKSLWTDMYC